MRWIAVLLLTFAIATPALADDPYGDLAPKAEARLAQVPAEGSDLLRLFQPVKFLSASTELATISQLVLHDVAAVIKEHPEWVSIEIGGHTDALGAAASNLALSQGRAESVRDSLVADGVAKERLVAKGYGETKLLSKDNDAVAHAKNRRVEFRVSLAPPEKKAE